MAYNDVGSSWDRMVLPLLQGAGTALTVAGDTSTAGGNAAASNFNAGVNDQNALIAESQGRDAVARQQRQAYLIEGAGRAGFGASGVRLDGSALDVLADSASRSELDRQTLVYNTNLKAQGFRQSAQLDRMRANYAQTSGMYKAASDALIGGANAWKMFGSPGTGTQIPDIGNVGELSAGFETGSALPAAAAEFDFAELAMMAL